MNRSMIRRALRRSEISILLAAATFWAPVVETGVHAQEVPTAGALTLQGAIEEALAGNAELRMARSRSDMAAAMEGNRSAIYWPRLDFESGFVRSNDPVFAFGTKLRQGTFGPCNASLRKSGIAPSAA